MSPTSMARRTLHVPITLSVSLMVLNVVLMVCWIILLAQDNYITALTIGTVLFVLILVGLVVYLILTIKEFRLNQRQANFVDSVTHELKSPITSLKMYLDTLRMRNCDPEIRERFQNFMLDDLSRLERLINQILQVGRLDAIAHEGETERIDLGEFLRECAKVARSAHNEKQVAIDFEIEPLTIEGRRLALEMIFRNLIDNAIKYGGTEPQVRIHARALGKSRVLVSVVDNGMGVPPPLRKKIFGLFYRGGSELERRRKGTGLGLFIVHTLLREMKGRVTVQGRGRNPGSVFEVELPGRVT